MSDANIFSLYIIMLPNISTTTTKLKHIPFVMTSDREQLLINH